MELIFWDMLRADLLAQEIARIDSSKNSQLESSRLVQQVYQIHHTNESEYKKSLSFYEERPQLLRTIFDSLNAKQTRKIGEKPDYFKNKRPANTYPFDKKPV